MNEPCNTASPLCKRCQNAPRLPGQRWCRACLTAAQRQRRAARRAAQAEASLPGHPAPSPVSPPVTQTSAQTLQAVTHPLQAPQHLPQAPTAPVQAPAPPRSHDITQALQAYRAAMQEYHAASRRAWPLLPWAPTLRVWHWWRKVEVTKQRWLTLVQGHCDVTGVSPPGLTARH